MGGSNSPSDCCVCWGNFPLFSCRDGTLSIAPPLAQIKSKRAHTVLPMMWQVGLLHQTGRERGVGGGAGPLDFCVCWGDFPFFLRWDGTLSIAPPLTRIIPKQVHSALPMMWQAGSTPRTGQRRGVGGGACPLDCYVCWGDFPLFSARLENLA